MVAGIIDADNESKNHNMTRTEIQSKEVNVDNLETPDQQIN